MKKLKNKSLKKLASRSFLVGITLTTAFALAGCGSSSNEQAVIDKLSHQLDRVSNTVAAVTTGVKGSELSVANVSKILAKTSDTSFTKLSSAYQKATSSVTNIEDGKDIILRKVKLIKRDLAGGVKLADGDAQAISDLTTSMQRYTSDLNKTKSDYKNTLKGIYKLIDSEDGNAIDAKITRLSCCLEARDCYLNNILLSLENIENILNGLENDEVTNEPNLPDSNEEQTDRKNIDTYNINGENKSEVNDAETPAQQNNFPNERNSTNFAGVNAYPNNGVNAYPNNGYAPYGNGAYRNGNFNPNRNTDTYGPGVTNIDTYRFNNGYNSYGYGNGYRNFGGSNGVNIMGAQSEKDNAQTPISSQDPISQSTDEVQNDVKIDVNETSQIPEQNNNENENKADIPKTFEINAEKSANENNNDLINKEQEKPYENKTENVKTASGNVKEIDRPLVDGKPTKNHFGPTKANKKDASEELKVKSVAIENNCPECKKVETSKTSAENTDNKNETNDKKPDEKPTFLQAEEEQSKQSDKSALEEGADKIKGHTQTVADINKDIEELIKK